MFRADTTIREVQSIIMDESPETLVRIMVWINQALDGIVKENDWRNLIREITLTPSATGRITVPADMLREISLMPATRYGQFQEVFMPLSYDVTRHTSLLYCHDELTMVDSGAKNATAVYGQYRLTAEQIPGDPVTFVPFACAIGNQISIGDRPDLYTVEDVDANGEWIDLEHPYIYGSGDVVVYESPAGRRVIRLMDNLFQAYTQSVILTYKRRHPAITDQSDAILIDCQQMLMIRTLQFAYRAGKYDIDANNLEGEYQKACRSDIAGSQSMLREASTTPAGSGFSSGNLRSGSGTRFTLVR